MKKSDGSKWSLTGSKKKLPDDLHQKRQYVDRDNSNLSISQQCHLLEIQRTGLYYEPSTESEINLWLMKEIDRTYTDHPDFGSRRMAQWLNRRNERSFNRKRIQRLMQKMGIQGILPGPHTSKPHPEHKIYPYLLRDKVIGHPNQVWSSDITFIPMAKGFMYLVAVIDWYSRYILSWELSNTQDTGFCLEALEMALKQGFPDIFNTDQGCQFTSKSFTGRLLNENIQISMDGRGRALDNIFIERFWRSIKYEDIYVRDYESVRDLEKGLGKYFKFYNEERPHQSLGYKTPLEIHFA